MFDALSITQTRNLMRRIGKAIQDTSQVCKILRTVAAGIRPDLDARHGDLHRDLCQLHSDLFDALMTKYAEADATLGAALALTRQS